jgi:hypothetical protein
LNTSCLSANSSNFVYSLSSILETFSGLNVDEMSVNPTMSEKKIVTGFLCSGSTWFRVQDSEFGFRV